MLADPTGKFETLVSDLTAEDKYMKALQLGGRTYNIRQFKVKQLKPHNILLTFYQISSRFYGVSSCSNQNNWHENQLKIFIWLIIGYCYLKKLSILQLNQQDWLFFSQIFKTHTPQALEYQAMLITKRKVKPDKWSIEEINLLNIILRQNKKNNMWKQTARNLYLYSQKKYFRTAKQCRQFWINHLDPIPIKTSWSTSEDIQLIQLSFLLNKKWSKISKQFGGRRTQHMVKNRYHSLYHSQLKKLPAQTVVREKTLMTVLRQKLINMNQYSVKIEQPLKTLTDLGRNPSQQSINDKINIQKQEQSYVSLYYQCRKNKQQENQIFELSNQIHGVRKEDNEQQIDLEVLNSNHNQDYLELSGCYMEEGQNFLLNKNQDSFLLLQ